MGDRRYIVGFGWSDIANAGKAAFPYIHQTGAAVLKGFGAGALVAPVENLEKQGGLLSKNYGAAPPDHIAKGADFVIVVHNDPSLQPTAVAKPDAVNVFGGTMFAGNGYATGADFGSKFSFGYDSPTSVDIILQGKKTSFTDAHQVLLCGGTGVDKQTQPPQKTTGDAVMSKSIVGTILGALGLDYNNEDHDDEDNRIGMLAMSGVTTKPVSGVAPVVTPVNKYVQGALVHAVTPVTGVIKPPPPAFGFQIKTSPVAGRPFTSLVLNKKKPFNPKTTVSSLRAIAQRAQQISATSLTKIAKAKTAAVAKPAAKKSIVGAAKAIAKVTMNLAALEQEAKKLASAGKDLSSHADKYEKTVNANATKAIAATKQGQVATGIHGFGFEDDNWHEISGATAIGWDEISDLAHEANCEFLEDVVGAGFPNVPPNGYYTDGTPIISIPGDTPDPNNPGLLFPSGALDPSYAGGGAAAGALASQLPGPPDYGAGTPPALTGGVVTESDGTTWPAPNVDYMPDPNPNGDDTTYYDCPTDADLPLGAVIFDGSHTPDFQFLGNYSVFFGQVPGVAPPKGGPKSGYSLHNDGWWLELKGTKPSTHYNGNHNYDHVGKAAAGYMSDQSQVNNWGPLIGNPNSWCKGLRFSKSGPNGPRWFWFYDMAAMNAPWAVASILQAHLNDSIANYKAAVVSGQTDYVNAELQDKLNAQAAAVQAAAQAAVDATVNQQQEAANAQSAIVQQQQADQQSALQLQQSQSQEQQAEQDAKLQAQASALQMQYFTAHPEAAFVAAPDNGGGQGGGGGGQDQGGGQTTDDGSGDPSGFGGAGDGSDADASIDWNSNTSSRSADDLATNGDGSSASDGDDMMQEANDIFPSE